MLKNTYVNIHKKLWGKKLSAYLDNALSGTEYFQLEDHLKVCDICNQQLKELREVSGILETWDEEEISADMDINIKQRLELTRSTGGVEMINLKEKQLVPIASVFVIVLVGALVFKNVQYQKIIKTQLETDYEGVTEVVSKPAIEMKVVSEKVVAKKQRVKAKKERQANMLNRQIVSQLNVQAAGGVLGSHATYDSMALSSSSYKGASAGGDYVANCMPMQPYGQTWEEPIPSYVEHNTEDYSPIDENNFKSVSNDPLSTLSIDVDTASYSNLRRFLNSGQIPPKDSVRLEEMINYFTYDYPQPKGADPFSVTTDVAKCPWNTDHDLALVGIQGKKFDKSQLPTNNLVFLLDTSGSMNQSNKLPLLIDAFNLLVARLSPRDKVSIVTYAGSAGVVLDSASGLEKAKIRAALRNLRAGGSTAGGAGIARAYDLAEANFIKGANNRVILATDGDFNIGASSNAEMMRLIEEEREKGIFLTCLGFGGGNYKDSKMELIANKGNGNYAYIDNINEARKVLVNDLQANLFTIAKDVKIQVEFNPDQVKAYRLIGYVNRVMNKEDFNDDTKDAGELGAGHSVTALYEIVPAGSKEEIPGVDELKYQKVSILKSKEMMTVKLRYKKPQETKSKLITASVKVNEVKNQVNGNIAWASAVAEFGMILRESQHKGSASYQAVLERTKSNQGEDEFDYRSEFIGLVETAYSIEGEPEPYYDENDQDTSTGHATYKSIDGYNPWN